MNKKPNKQQQLTIVVVVAIVAIVGAVAAIMISSRPASASGIEFVELHHERMPDGGFVLGNPDAPITIVEFADFLCPFCQGYKPTMNEFVRDQVVTGRARYEYRMLPTQQQSSYLAQLAECAHEQRDAGFWYAYDELFAMATSGSINRDAVGRDLANRLDINYTQLLTCSSDAGQVFIDQQLGSNNGVTGTPAVRMRLNNGPLQVVAPGREGGPVPMGELVAVVDMAQSLTGQ
jgi:protein-disulfide isomerase